MSGTITGMHNVPIMFFQVAATAIPTLLIAVAVGIKQGATYAEYYGQIKRPWVKIMLVGMTVVLGLAIALGEFAALRAIARGSGNGLEAELVFSAIYVCFMLIFMELLAPFAQHMTLRAHSRLLGSAAAVWTGFAVYFMLILYGVVPL